MRTELLQRPCGGDALRRGPPDGGAPAWLSAETLEALRVRLPHIPGRENLCKWQAFLDQVCFFFPGLSHVRANVNKPSKHHKPRAAHCTDALERTPGGAA